MGIHRGRRLRRTAGIRAMVAETQLAPSQLVAPQRSIAQISLCGPISTPAVEPQGRPSGNTPQFLTDG